jgi:hypothetical protein
MFYRASAVFYFPDHKMAHFWVAAGLSPADEHMLSRALKNCPQLTVTREKIGRPALCIVPTSAIIDGIIPDNKASISVRQEHANAPHYPAPAGKDGKILP